jgi:hypothetical protein
LPLTPLIHGAHQGINLPGFHLPWGKGYRSTFCRNPECGPMAALTEWDLLNKLGLIIEIEFKLHLGTAAMSHEETVRFPVSFGKTWKPRKCSQPPKPSTVNSDRIAEYNQAFA